MNEEFWFRPKTFGYGATPVTWQGWAVVAAYVAIVATVTILMVVRGEQGLVAWAAGVLVMAIAIATSAVILVSWSKTDGAWQWRWGNSESSGKAI